jgi:transglutaminase-like putative cysteine protease
VTADSGLTGRPGRSDRSARRGGRPIDSACAGAGRCAWHITNRFRYQYAALVTRASTRLRLLPRPRHGSQRVIRTDLTIDPLPRSGRSFIDRFGNCVLDLEHDRLPAHLEVTAEICVADTAAGPAPGGTLFEFIATPVVSEARSLYLVATRLTDRSTEIELLAAVLRREFPEDARLSWECMHRVFQEMRYVPGTTGVATAASEAFARREGVCQDFAQVMLSLLRAAGLPARYVSGHMEGEGQMHAWVEALYAPSPGVPPVWHPLDPTHDRAVGDNYVTIAVGRDFADISPLSGWCYGPAPGRLTAQQQMRRTAPCSALRAPCSD